MRELFEQAQKAQEKRERAGSESTEELLPDHSYVHYEGSLEKGPLSEWLSKTRGANSLLNAPILACTIDHLVPATESTRGGHQIAVVEMRAIPTSEKAEQLHKEQSTNTLLDRFDTTETYAGKLKLDITGGKVEKYFEELRTEWVAVDPEAEPEDDKEPDSLTMTAIRLYNLEKID